MFLCDLATLSSFSQIHERKGYFFVNDVKGTEGDSSPSRIHKDLPIVWFPEHCPASDDDLYTSSHVVLVFRGKIGVYMLEFERDSVRMYGHGSRVVDCARARKSYQEYGLYCLYSPNYFGFGLDLQLSWVGINPTISELRSGQLLEMFLRPGLPDVFCTQERQTSDGEVYYIPNYAGLLRSSK